MCEHVLGENSDEESAAMNFGYSFYCGCHVGVVVSAAFCTIRVTHVINY